MALRLDMKRRIESMIDRDSALELAKPIDITSVTWIEVKTRRQIAQVGTLHQACSEAEEWSMGCMLPRVGVDEIARRSMDWSNLQIAASYFGL